MHRQWRCSVHAKWEKQRWLWKSVSAITRFISISNPNRIVPNWRSLNFIFVITRTGWSYLTKFIVRRGFFRYYEVS